MEPMDVMTRTMDLERLESGQFDVLVIGGGITGAGVALDAAARGYRVALVEKSDFASGTSSKSTKLLHGGIRYLPQFDFALVHEALVERGLLLQNAPFLAEPLAFLLPLYANARRPVGIPIVPPKGIGLGLLLDIGLWLYDIMAGTRGMRLHKRISVERAVELVPAIKREGLKEAFLYYDAQTNDTRLTMTVLKTAVQHGAVIANYTEVTRFTKDDDGTLTGAEVRDTLDGRTFTIQARHIVNAAGIFAGRVMELSGDESKVAIAPSKGVHLVTSLERVGITDTAVVLPETTDGRILFVIPWESRAVIGTTDTGSGDLDHPVASAADIEYLLAHVNQYMNVDLTSADILSTYAGYRPLVRSKGARTANLSRTHVVIEEDNGMVTIVGGKLTTYRRMAQDTVDVLRRRDKMPFSHPTQRLLLSGAIGWSKEKPKIEARARKLGLPDRVIEHLTFDFGTHASTILDLMEEDPSLARLALPDLPYTLAEIVYICRHEMAVTVDDVLARRTRISIEDGAHGSGVAPEVAEIMGRELKWSADRLREGLQQYLADLRGNTLAGLPAARLPA